MTINLSNQSHIATALFVKITVPNYNTLTFSNYYKPLVIGSDTYTGLGQLMSVSDTSSELKVSAQELTIGISGIVQQNIADVLSYKFIGSPVNVYRGIFDTKSGELLTTVGTNPIGKFTGIVNNFSLVETWQGQDASNTLNLVCSSTIGFLQKKVAGRRTNPMDEEYWFQGDKSMNRVPNLANSSFNFGAK
jgi:hypothetical protein